MAVGADDHAFKGAQPQRRVLHEYRQEQSDSQSDRDHGRMIRELGVIFTGLNVARYVGWSAACAD
jgi:hypothetical protein